ncbi:PilZ domain-containing protein [Pelagerythrobacter rhizovicinus]|uniref:PilZ domain-containing protein n=1 Tax=Pelagerythrobacter rhizovicinus TaxID=2268576 RepID=A0A4Q2KMH4_9SPHN|nr:PilZ domain-containing protein [Pelagerythrobacter rhizovicinus]RXZ64603.1 PilZ domain-containing protein [Pelagerythrobacter rhizovicinus]
MEQPAGETAINHGATGEERAAPRFTLLIRSAKLIAPQGQFLCVIRDVSATGISLRGFHPLPDGEPLLLELQTGDRHAIERVWSRGNEAGFRFAAPVEVGNLIAETGEYPKRPLRLDIDLPLDLRCGGERIEADLVNLSQHGARIECAHFLALGQPLWIMSDRLPEIEARVRWRDGSRYGLTFDTTFNLRDFALLAARLQCPRLLSAPV